MKDIYKKIVLFVRKINLKRVTKDTWIRTIVLILALGNQGMVLFGKDTKVVPDSVWYEYVSWLFTIVSTAVSWWKNNSFTDRAQNADDYLHNDNYSLYKEPKYYNEPFDITQKE